MAWMKNRDNSGGQQKDYLNAADTAGRPMALASILFTLLFIAALALLLFSAGRWAYNQMIDEEVTVSTTQQETTSTTETKPAEVATSSSSESTTPTDETAASSANSSNEASTSASSETSTTTATTTVPNTGPGSLISVFIISALLATLVHYRWQIVKNR